MNIIGMAKNWKLTKKFTVSILLVLVAVFAAMTVILSAREHRVLVNELAKKGKNLTNLLATISAEPILSFNVTYLENYVRYASVGDEDVATVLIQDAEGKTLAGYTVKDKRLDDVIEYSSPIQFESNKIGTVKIGFLTSNIKKEIRNSQLVILALSVATLMFISFIVSLLFQRIAIQPLHQLKRIMRKFASGDLTQSLEVASHDEIGELGRTVMDMSAYLREMARKAEEIAGGDLRSEVVPKSDEDVFGRSFKKMVEGLRSLIAEIRGGADQLTAASTQIAASSDQSSKNSETSASAIEEMTATMHEMSSNMQTIAKNTQQQAQSATDTSSSIEQMVASIHGVAQNVQKLVAITEKSRNAVTEGSATVNKAAKRMSEINDAIQTSAETIMRLGDKTEDMSKIVEVIDDIAEQTNLLALNAAIEAAKAGEQGLGFAVVADEVRKLAERSAQSTKEIADLIRSIAKEAQSSVDQMKKSAVLVEEGYRYSTDVNTTLRGIESAVEDVLKYTREIGVATQDQSQGSNQIKNLVQGLRTLTQEIAAASEEQYTGADQVVKAIERIKDMVQQNSSGAVELAASAEQLSRQATGLQGLVDKFVLNGSARIPAQNVRHLTPVNR